MDPLIVKLDKHSNMNRNMDKSNINNNYDKEIEEIANDFSPGLKKIGLLILVVLVVGVLLYLAR